jgi:LmbE family N-acetylglucosaminyl deacetylase
MVSMDYAQFVKATESLYLDQLRLTQLGHAPAPLPKLGAPPSTPNAAGPGSPPTTLPPAVLIVAPHPDDECLMGSYAFRMKLEWNARVVVFPFTLGSKKERQAERLQELRAACKVLDFEVSEVPDLPAAIAAVRPDFVFSPHAEDGHPAHRRAHEACREAIPAFLAATPGARIQWLQTEFWHAMKAPNLLIPLSAEHVAMMGLALAQHQGEVARNPYHLRLPAWFMDQVRRGSEQVGGAGGSGLADWVFGQLYLRVDVGGAP